MLCAFTIVFISSKSIGQIVEPSSVVEKNILQLELETLYSIEKKASQKTTSWDIPNILIRYGLSDNIELQLHTPFTKERYFEYNELTTNIFKFEEGEFGISINLWGQNKFLPETAIMARIVSSTNTLKFNELGNIVSLNFSNLVSKKLRLNYNIGTTTNIKKHTTGFYILNISYEPNSQVHYFLENSSDFTLNNVESNSLGMGFGLNLSNNLAMDFSATRSLNHDMFSTGVILTWAINTKKQ